MERRFVSWMRGISCIWIDYDSIMNVLDVIPNIRLPSSMIKVQFQLATGLRFRTLGWIFMDSKN